MEQPERLSALPPYPFPRLRALLAGIEPGGAPVRLSIGEPRHPQPPFVGEVLAGALEGFGRYPPNEGSAELRAAVAGWLERRYGARVDPEQQVLALNGTREGLFNAALALCPDDKRGRRPEVLIPNPFYQVYAAGALAAGALPVFLPAVAETGFLPDLDAIHPAVLDRCALFYLCSPSNPQGAVASRAYLVELLRLAERHDFRVLLDECYAEIYRDTPPAGGLEALGESGADPERLLVFHSLSKRSNLPGLRSGFVAGGAGAIGAMRKLRAYGGAPLPLPLQAVAARAWADEDHVEANRALYRAKYALADRVFGDLPGWRPVEAGFFLWLPVSDDDEAARVLWRRAGLEVLPGSYLGREVGGVNPGAGYIRVALVAPEEELAPALARLREVLEAEGLIREEVA